MILCIKMWFVILIILNTIDITRFSLQMRIFIYQIEYKIYNIHYVSLPFSDLYNHDIWIFLENLGASTHFNSLNVKGQVNELLVLECNYSK